MVPHLGPGCREEQPWIRSSGGEHPTAKDPAERRGQLDRNVSCSMTGVALRLSEDGSMG